MAQQVVRLANFNDFTGGLNLRRDAFLLAPNESPDLMNVDIDARGGFRQRRGTVPLSNTAFANEVTNLWEFNPRSAGSQLMAHSSGQVHYSTGGAFTSTGINRGGTVRAASFADRCYLANGASNNVRWNGSSYTVLGTSWSNDLAAPTGGGHPWAECIASHVGSLWLANTVENGTAYPNRVRWSHPNKPEDFRSKDFIDVDPGVDGDEITALVPHTDHLIVFKRNSVHAIYGYNHETFQVVPKSQTVGAISQEAVVATEGGVFFWSWPQGVFGYDNNGVHWLFEPLFPAIENGDISSGAGTKVQLGWGNRRLWVSVPWQGSATRSRTFVYDPTLGDAGAWTQYDLPLGPYLEWSPPGARSHFVAAQTATKTVIELDLLTDSDNFTGTDLTIASRLRTGWVDLGNPAVTKRWKRPQIVLKGGTSANVYVKVYKDYDPTHFVRQFTVDTTADGADIAVPVIDTETGIVTGSGWDSALWDTATWGRGTTGGGGTIPDRGGAESLRRNEIHRGSPLGTAKAIALEFIGPTTEAAWGVDSLTFKYKPRKVRS